MKTRQAILCIIALLLLFPTVSFSQSDLTNTELEVEELIRLSVKSIRTDLDSSVIYANMIIAYGEDRNSLKYLSLGYKNLGQSYRYMNQQEKAREAYHKAVEYAEKNNDAESAARIYPLIAHTYAAKGDNKNAMKWQKTAKKHAKENKDTLLLGNTSLDIGVIHAQKGEFYIAVEYFFNCIEYYEAIEKTGYTIRLLNNIGSIYSDIEEYEKALIYFKKAEEKLKTESNTSNQLIASLFLNIGRAYTNLKEYDKAIENYETALSIVENLKNNVFVGTAYNQLGSVYSELKELKQASIFYKKAYNLLKNEQQNDAFSATLRGLAKIEQQKGNYQKALKYIKESSLINVSIDNLDDIVIDYEILSTVYNNLGNSKKAYDYLQQHLILKDSLDEINKVSEIILLESKYNYKQEQFELKSEVKDLKKDKVLEQSKTTILGLSLLSVCIILAGVFWFFYQNRKENNLLKKDLENKQIIEQQSKELRGLNETLQISNQQLKDLDKTKTRFFANLSHELKTPLTLILNPLQKALKSKKLNDDNNYLVRSAEKNSLQLFDLIYQVLELTKFETNKVFLNPAPIHFTSAMGKLYADFESLAANRKINFELKNEANKDLKIEIDEYKFTTIIKNLISNALKFTTENGTVKLQVEEQTDTLQISVSDTGRGIHQQDLPYVFDRYYQSKISGDIMEGGTGIGLAICKEYAVLMDGNIQVESIYGQGSTFIVQLPKTISEAIINEKTEPQLTKIIPKSTEIISLDSDNSTILVVDDNMNMQEYLDYILQPNYNVIIAPHGKAALEILDSNPNIDLVVTDLMMPEMNGQELISEMKSIPQFAGIPVIMLTALSGMDEKLKALRVGIDDYILKPFVDEELLARIDNLIANSEERQQFKQMSIGDNKTHQNILKNVEIQKEDLEWLTQFEGIVEKNYKDFHFTIDDYTEELLMSRTKVYQKVKELTGLTPKRYINEIRFRAARLLMENKKHRTVKAIAYEVGFKDQKYFSRSFKKRFGKSPSEFL